MSDPYIGEIIMFAGNFAPRGWAFCDGSLLPISQYTAVFSLLGTTYGGNGTTNFALPDLRGRAPFAPGNAYALGQKGGNEQATLTVGQLPAHTHVATATVTINADGGRAATTAAAGAVPSGPAAAAYASRPDGTTTMNAGMATATVTVQPAGGNLPVPTLPPYLCVTFIIALEGIFPSRP
jgi:microcystin-dependent protein